MLLNSSHHPDEVRLKGDTFIVLSTRPSSFQMLQQQSASANEQARAEDCGTDYQGPGPRLVSSRCAVLPN